MFRAGKQDKGRKKTCRVTGGSFEMWFWHLACGLKIFCAGTGSRGSMVEELERVDQVKNPWEKVRFVIHL